MNLFKRKASEYVIIVLFLVLPILLFDSEVWIYLLTTQITFILLWPQKKDQQEDGEASRLRLKEQEQKSQRLDKQRIQKQIRTEGEKKRLLNILRGQTGKSKYSRDAQNYSRLELKYSKYESNYPRGQQNYLRLEKNYSRDHQNYSNDEQNWKNPRQKNTVQLLYKKRQLENRGKNLRKLKSFGTKIPEANQQIRKQEENHLNRGLNFQSFEEQEDAISQNSEVAPYINQDNKKRVIQSAQKTPKKGEEFFKIQLSPQKENSLSNNSIKIDNKNSQASKDTPLDQMKQKKPQTLGGKTSPSGFFVTSQLQPQPQPQRQPQPQAQAQPQHQPQHQPQPNSTKNQPLKVEEQKKSLENTSIFQPSNSFFSASAQFFSSKPDENFQIPKPKQESTQNNKVLSQKEQVISIIPGPFIPKAEDTRNENRALNISGSPNIVLKPKKNLTSQQILQTYITFFGQNAKEQIPIATKIESLMGGARSSPNIILIEAKSLLGTIDKNDDKQVTAFALKLFESIVNNFINNSNIKSGLQRIPLRQRTKQCQKNAINAYILTLNMYRLMPQGYGRKIWSIVFGKTLKMLQFLFKRKEDLQSFHKLQLIQCNYIRKYKEVHSKYVSRIDFLIYFLLGLTAYDPILILRQVQQKQRQVQTSRAEVQSWGNKWRYSEFWALTHAVMSNKHECYSKPIFYINLLYVLYPRIYQHKLNPAEFQQEHYLFLVVLTKAKIYLKAYDKMSQVRILSKSEETDQYQFDGPDFIKSIKILESRISEKEIEFKLNFKEFETKANVFYYFTKEK